MQDVGFTDLHLGRGFVFIDLLLTVVVDDTIAHTEVGENWWTSLTVLEENRGGIVRDAEIPGRLENLMRLALLGFAFMEGQLLKADGLVGIFAELEFGTMELAIPEIELDLVEGPREPKCGHTVFNSKVAEGRSDFVLMVFLKSLIRIVIRQVETLEDVRP